MPEKFLILGRTSFYGNEFAKFVQEKGEAVELLGRGEFDLNCGDNPNNHEVRKSWRWFFDALRRNPNYIVNFMSKSLVAESWVSPWDWCRTNVESTARLLEALKDYRGKFIHVSTPEVYGDMEPWQDETCRFNPSTPYAVSRAAGDMMLMAYYRAHGFQAVITRTANIYGSGQGKNRIIPLAFDTFRQGKRLDLHGGGHTVRSFIHVRDACAATYLIAKQGTPGQTYHISTTRLTSIQELAKMICKRLGLDPKQHLGSQDDRLGKDQTYALDSRRIRTMGWRDTITLEKGLEEYAGT